MTEGRDDDLGECEGFYQCETCGKKTAQGRGCSRCGGDVVCTD